MKYINPTDQLFDSFSQDPNDTVNKRVADFTCQYILLGHQGSVTSLVVIDRKQGYNGTHLVSAHYICSLLFFSKFSGWNLKILPLKYL